MRNVYRALAYLVAAGVVVQAAAIAFALFGLSTWIQGGGTLDKSAMESGSSHFTGESGFAVHGIGGMTVIPLLALLLLVVSFFARITGGVAWALYVVATVVVQVALAMFSGSAPVLGMLHGATALGLFWVAWTAGRRAGRTTSAPAPAYADTVAGASR